MNLLKLFVAFILALMTIGVGIYAANVHSEGLGFLCFGLFLITGECFRKAYKKG